MTREKYIEALTRASTKGKEFKIIKVEVTIDFINGLLAILKEQEPVPPEWEGGGSSYWHVCGECHGMISDVDSYCRHCGRRIKWDGN